MKTIACIIARTNSTRLPKKVLLKHKGKRLIEYLIEKIKLVKKIDEIYLCTSIDETDKILIDIAKKNGIKSYAGSREAIIERMLDVARIESADNVVRITGDNIFTDEILLQKMIDEHNQDPKIDYTRIERVPLGIFTEVIKVDVLKKCYHMIDPTKSEYLLLYIFNPANFSCQVLIPPQHLQDEYGTLTVDTPKDWQRTKFLIDKLYQNGRIFYDDIINLSRKIDIPHYKLNKTAPIKMPDDKTITYQQFRQLLRERTKKSKQIKLAKNFYENQKNN